MTLDTIRYLYEARPFRPFALHLADGRNVAVQHPEVLAFAPAGRTIVVVLPDNGVRIIDLELVTEVEVKPGRPGRKAA